jgi:hypothetical protein
MSLAAACSGERSDRSVAAPPSTATAIAPARSATSSPAGTDPSGSVGGTGEPADLADLERTWIEVWAAAAAPAGDRADALDGLRPVVSEAAIATVEPALEADQLDRTVANHPVVTAEGATSAVVDDCLLVTPPTVPGPALWYQGVAHLDSDGAWVIDSIELQSRTGCVPAALADEVLGGYRQFWDARAEYWNPADPDHPGVTATMTGVHLDYMRELLDEHRRQGWYAVIEGQRTHPEIIAVEGPDRVVILDCQEAAAERGLFDAAGQRQPGIGAPQPGDHDIFEVTMQLEDGQWKAADVGALEAVDCELAPTDRGLPRV